jgi:hypothetical protein
MNETTKFKIPDNTEFIEQSLENGMLVTKFIPKVGELKDLDCIFGDGRFMISNGRSNGYRVLIGCFEPLGVYENGTFNRSSIKITKITREEMQTELAKHGKYFDFEEKVLKPLRSRAENNEIYYYVADCFEVEHDYEALHEYDNERFAIGNYHQTKEQCEEYAKKMIEYSKSLIK